MQTVLTAMRSYAVEGWQVSVEHPPGTQVRRSYHWLWDLNQPGSGRAIGDGLIDGHPATLADATHDGPFDQALILSGYAGFARMAAPDLLGTAWLNERGQPIDAWKHPLHIAIEGVNAGPGGIRVWSSGPDGIDQSGAGDDLAGEGR